MAANLRSMCLQTMGYQRRLHRGVDCMTNPILHIHVGEPLTNSLARAARTMEALEREETPPPYFSIGFADMSPLLATLTPRRW